jgi:ubiquinone/menaquinone biosynthesis C-methylase UbiE
MADFASESQVEFIERMRRQYNFGPYPRIPIDKTPGEDSNDLLIHNLTTPFYLRDRQVISSEGKVILDAGCGTGYKALLLARANPGAKVIGIDLSSKSVELAQQRAEFQGYQDQVEFHILEIHRLPELGIQFDYINCDEVLYFLNDIAAGLSDLKRVLRPNGIIRANLHSALQRQIFFRAQELFTLLGLMDPEAEEMAMPIAIEIMQALNPSVNLKEKGWRSSYEELAEDNKNSFLLSNHLMKEDKGYRIADLFAALNKAELNFLSMTNWRYWDFTYLFSEPDNLPAYLAMGLDETSIETKLTIYELLNPIHRLFDFWCTNPVEQPTVPPVAEWTLAHWQYSRVFLNPQLHTEAFQKAALEAIQKNEPFVISNFLSLPTINPISISYDVTALLLQLWNGPQIFTTLVNFWQQTHPVNLLTLEPITPEFAAQQVADALSKLEVFLYVLPEQIA